MGKNWRTNLIGLIGIIFLVIGMVLVLTKKITFTELVGSLAIVSTFLGALNSFFSKDSNVTGGTVKQ